MNLVPEHSTVPDNGRADLIWSRLCRFEDRLFACIRVLAEPYLQWDGSTIASSFAAIVLGASAFALQ